MTNVFQVSKTAATCIVGYNMFQNETWNNVSYARKIKSFAIVGSTNVGDCAVDLKIGQRIVGTFYNTQGGANVVPEKEDTKFPNAYVKSGDQVQCIVTDAAAANPVIVEIAFDPVKRSSFRRWTGARRSYSYRPRTTSYRRY